MNSHDIIHTPVHSQHREAHTEQVKSLLAKEAAEKKALDEKWYKIKNDWTHEIGAMNANHRKETWALQDM